MCYQGKCMHCLEVETGALIFAILNVMVTSMASVVSMGGLVYTTFIAQAVIQKAENDGDERMMEGALVFGVTTNVVFAVLAVAFCISFSFAVVLIVGLCKRKASLVKCYFVYGVTKTVLGAATIIGFLVNMQSFPVTLLLIILQLLYCLILLMIHMTYKKFEAEIPFTSFSNPISTIQKF